MMIPPKLRHNDNLGNLFEKFNAVIDYLREIRLIAGNGIRLNRLPAGTTIESTATAEGGFSSGAGFSSKTGSASGAGSSTGAGSGCSGGVTDRGNPFSLPVTS